ncbi:MAG: hypothetical protein K0B15_12295 [Lentimicrobium sp.]|nr:hypothetical protein [Lentimicrobium sp.]
MTPTQFRDALPYATAFNRSRFYAPILDTFTKFCIDTKLRQAAFLAQIAHESGSLKYVKEIASGFAYEGRKDLGNTEPGDGPKYKGRGLIQLTGRANYDKASIYFGVDFVAHPEFIEQPLYAALVSGWYWHTRKLNMLADVRDIRRITKLINGGYNGIDMRIRHYERALKAFGIK